jgi:hypothetical protein
VFPDLSYKLWCNDLTYRLTITSKVREQLKQGNICVLQAPVFFVATVENDASTAVVSNTEETTVLLAFRSSYAGNNNSNSSSGSVDNGVYGGVISTEDRMEAMRQSKLVLQSLFNDILLNTNCISMPNIEFWGPTPDKR